MNVKVPNIVNTYYKRNGLTAGSLTLNPTTAGNVLIAMALSFAGDGVKWVAPNFLSTSDGNLTEVPFYSLPGQGGALWDWATITGSGVCSDILYQVTSGGVTSISWDTNLTLNDLYVWEVSGLITPVVIDDHKVGGSATAVTVTGTPLTSSHTNDLCIQNLMLTTLAAHGVSPVPWAMQQQFVNDAGGPLFLNDVSGSASVPSPLQGGATVSDKYIVASVAFASNTPFQAPDIKYVRTDSRNLLLRYVDHVNNIHTFPTISGNEKFITSGLYVTPWGMAANSPFLYVVDEGAEYVLQADIRTGYTQVIAGGATGSGALGWSFRDIYEVCVDSRGNLAVADVGLKQTVGVNMNSTTQVMCGVSIAPGGAAVIAGTGFVAEYGIAFDSADNLYVSDQGNTSGSGNVIRKVNGLTGSVSIYAGIVGMDTNTGDGGPPGSATLDSPLTMAFDNNGILFVICNGINGGSAPKIRAINTSATARTVNGVAIAPNTIQTIHTFLSTPAKPWFVRPDNLGNLHVCDTGTGSSGGCSYWMIDSSGAISIIAGSPTGACGYSGDGGLATSALVGESFGVAVLGKVFCGGMSSQVVGNPLV